MAAPTNPGPDPNRELPAGVKKWAVAVDGQVLTYAQVHELMHRDISIGNEYRKERIKLLTTLATGVFALTVTFHKDLFHSTLTPEGLSLLLLGWAALIVSLLAGIYHFRKWEDFYLEHRAQGNALWRYRIATEVADQTKARSDFNLSADKMQAIQEIVQDMELHSVGWLGRRADSHRDLRWRDRLPGRPL